MSVIEFAEHRLAEEERQHELGADNRYDLHYWAAYLDGAREQKKEGGELAMSALNYVERQGFMTGMDYAGMTAEERETLLKELRNLRVGPVAQLPKRGEWIDRYDEDDKPFFKRKYVCSACGDWNTYGKSKYCPNCGAKMNDSNASNALNALDNAQDGPIITPCRGCSDYDGYGGCKSKGGCARAKMEVQ